MINEEHLFFMSNNYLQGNLRGDKPGIQSREKSVLILEGRLCGGIPALAGNVTGIINENRESGASRSKRGCEGIRHAQIGRLED